MKREKDNAGRTVRIFEAGDGVRRRFRDLLDDVRFTYPRKLRLDHRIDWYFGDGPLARPLFGMYSMGVFAERLLWKARHGRRLRPDFVSAVRFFAATRRAMRNAIDDWGVSRRLEPSELVHARRVVRELAELAAKVFEDSNLTPTTRL